MLHEIKGELVILMKYVFCMYDRFKRVMLRKEKAKASNQLYYIRTDSISKTGTRIEEQQKATNGEWKHATKTKTSNKERQRAFFIPIFIHLLQLWTYGRWLCGVTKNSLIGHTYFVLVIRI